jgi:hypothetical protein
LSAIVGSSATAGSVTSAAITARTIVRMVWLP